MQRRRPRLSYANVTSTLALVIALSTGGVYAANTIRSSDIVNGQVKRADIAANAVSGGKVQNGSLRTVDVTHVVARPRGTADVVTGSPANRTAYPLVRSSWPSVSSELGWWYGSFRVTMPSSAACNDLGYSMWVDLYLNGGPAGSTSVNIGAADFNQTVTVGIPFRQLAPPIAGKKRTVTAKVYDDCPGGSFIVRQVNLTVFGLR